MAHGSTTLWDLPSTSQTHPDRYKFRPLIQWQRFITLTMATSMCRFRVVGKILNFSIGKKCIYHQSLRTFTISSYNFTKVLNSQFFIKSATKSQVLVSKKEVLVNRLFSTEKKLSKEEITEKVLNVCRTFDKIPTDKLTLEAHFMNDLGLDSLDHVELIMNIEDDFNFEIPDGDAEKLLRPSDIVAYVEQKEATSKIV